MDMSKLIYQIQRHTNDRNGNPRRITVGYHPETGVPAIVIDHGYSGDSVPQGAVQLSGVDITGSEYQSTIRWAKGAGIYLGS